jgi:Ca2+-binding RTX toxin-like protein
MNIRHRVARRAFAGLAASALGSAALIGVTALPASAADFTSGAAIALPNGSAAGVTKSINVAGLLPNTTDVNVRLNGVTHGNADDIDVVIEHPDGTKVMLMSDARGTDNIANANLTFNSSVNFFFPPIQTLSNSQTGNNVGSGSYRPADFDTGTASAPEAVAPFTDGTTGTTLSVFNGKNPNGTWKLHAADDLAGANTGSLGGGFTLQIQAAEPGTPPPCGGQTPTIVGTGAGETIFGTPDTDIIFAGGGDDTVISGGGADLVCGGDGNDTLIGKKGKDSLFGGAGDDTLLGGKDKDKLFGEDGNDTLKGGKDKDRCDGGAGTDTVAKCERRVNIP